MSNRPFNVSVDVMSAGAIAATFAGLLPPLAGLAGLIWYGIQIWESKTVQKHLRLWKAKARAKRLAGLKTETAQLETRIADVQAAADKPST